MKATIACFITLGSVAGAFYCDYNMLESCCTTSACGETTCDIRELAIWLYPPIQVHLENSSAESL